MGSSVLVTGGTGGLGTAVTAALLDEGYRVVVPWIAERELKRLADHERLELVRADLFDAGDARRCAEIAASDSAAPLQAVVNLVGGFAMGGRVHEMPIDEFERQLTLNVRATYLACQATLPHLIEAGGGSIVCVSSRSALRPFPGASGYITGKAAVLGLVDALATEYAADGVRVNALLPSIIDTPGNRASQPNADRSTWVSPERIARVVLYLCSEASAAVSGARIPVDRP